YLQPTPLPLTSHLSPPTALSTLSLHDALPICTPTYTRRVRGCGRCAHGGNGPRPHWHRPADSPRRPGCGLPAASGPARPAAASRSEEHTSELQSRFDLVCRLLLEKKKKE